MRDLTSSDHAPMQCELSAKPPTRSFLAQQRDRVRCRIHNGEPVQLRYTKQQNIAIYQMATYSVIHQMTCTYNNTKNASSQGAQKATKSHYVRYIHEAVLYTNSIPRRVYQYFHVRDVLRTATVIYDISAYQSSGRNIVVNNTNNTPRFAHLGARTLRLCRCSRALIRLFIPQAD